VGQPHTSYVFLLRLILAWLQFWSLSVVLSIAHVIVVVIIALLRPKFLRTALSCISVHLQNQFVDGAVKDLDDFGKTLVEGLV